jgi:hypothetical protein
MPVSGVFGSHAKGHLSNLRSHHAEKAAMQTAVTAKTQGWNIFAVNLIVLDDGTRKAPRHSFKQCIASSLFNYPCKLSIFCVSLFASALRTNWKCPKWAIIFTVPSTSAQSLWVIRAYSGRGHPCFDVLLSDARTCSISSWMHQPQSSNHFLKGYA